MTIVGGSILAGPLAANAQRPAKPYQIGFLHPGVSNSITPLVDQFRRGLQELGYTEGPSLTIHYRFAEGNQSRLQDQGTDLVRLKMDVIVACTSRAAVAAHKETQTIPIVMINVGDPIRIGLVASLARPGGNVTGTASYLPELAGKHLEILKELVPGMKHLAVLWTPDNPLHASNLRDLDEPARLLGVQVHALRVLGPGDFESAFRTAVNERASAAWIFGDPMFIDNRNRLSALAVNIRMPTMFTARQFADAGGLVVYAPVASESYLRAATFVDKILKGAKPSDLPVEQPTKFELIINLKTAKAIGLTIPQSLLVRADEIIQ